MKTKTATRRAMLLSLTSLLICAAMLVGTTFAWFTDSVTSGTNRIIAGNLDVELTHENNGSNGAQPVQGSTDLFQTALGNELLWEPGAAAYEKFTVSNVGTLALKYQLSLSDIAYNSVTWANTGAAHNLTEVIKIAVLPEDATITREAIAAAATSTIAQAMTGAAFSAKSGSLQPNESETFTVALYWAPNDNDTDNLYNLKNGAYGTENITGWTLDEDPNNAHQLYLETGVTLLASQYTSEFDSFDNQYDATATDQNGSTIGYTLAGTQTKSYTASEATAIEITDVAKATVPANTTLTYNDGTTEVTVEDNATLRLTVEETDDIGNLTVQAGTGTTSYEVTLETVLASGAYKVSATNNAIVTTLNIDVVDLQSFYHNGVAMTAVGSAAEVDQDGEYYYNQGTGIITMATKTFSPFTSVYKYDGGIGTQQYPYLIASADQWKVLADECKQDTEYASTSNKFYSITRNIDVSSYVGEQLNIQYFGGHINWNGNTITGLSGLNAKRTDTDGNTGIFNNVKGDVVIENMNFTTYSLKANNGTIGNQAGGQVALQLTCFSRGGHIVIRNINIYGNAINNGSNNIGLLMYGYYGDTEQDVTFENCSNYANITSTHGYASVFLGCMMDGTIRFTNCKNYGKLVSLGSASMLIANPSYAKTAVVHVDDCANNGLIMCSNEASAYSLFGTLVENIFYANALTVNGVSAPITSYYVTNANFQTFLSNEAITSELTGNPITYQSGSVAIPVSDNKFVLNTTDGAAYYTLSFSFTAGNHAGGNAGYVLRFDSELPNDIMVGSWITKAEAETLGAEIVAHEAYGTTYYTCDGRYVFYEDGGTIRNNVSVSFIAYSSENTPLSIATYEYQG